MTKLQEAFALAQKWHGDQLYGDRPYIYHLVLVLRQVEMMYKEDPDLEHLRVLAVLHDLFEDTDIQKDEGDMKHLIEILGGRGGLGDLVLLTKFKEETYTKYLRFLVNRDSAYKVKKADIVVNRNQNIQEGNKGRVKYYQGKLNELSELRLGHLINEAKNDC